MFKKLKQKISEEQVPPRGVGGRAGSLSPQVPSKSPPSTGNRIRPTSFTDQNDEGTLTPDKEDVKELIWPRFFDFLSGKSLGEYEVLKP